MLANTCSLTAYSAGVLNALVVECGHGATNITPVYEGVALRYAVPKVGYVTPAAGVGPVSWSGTRSLYVVQCAKACSLLYCTNPQHHALIFWGEPTTGS